MRCYRTSAWTFPWFVVVLLLTAGCGRDSSVGTTGPAADLPPLSQEDQALYRNLESELSKIINEESIRHESLRYEYNEGLLDILDQAEQIVSGTFEGEPPRFLPKLDPDEEIDHFRETIRRWEAKTGKNLREEVDTLQAEVAARDPKEAFHPEFQKKFSETFDDFIAIEVAEMRERRNRAIHAAAEEQLLEPHRSENPEVVQRIEQILNTPPYHLPSTEGS